MSINILNKINIKSILSIWLDVCKSKIDVCIINNNEKDIYFKITNNKKWLLDFINCLKINNFNMEIPLIIESTWDYDTLACILFSEARFNIKEINPIMTKNYIKSSIRWTKTDKTDAKVLANIWIISKKELFTFKKTKSFIAISKKISLMSTLEKQIQSLKMTIKNFEEVHLNLELDVSVAVKNINISIQELESNIKLLQKEIELESVWEDGDNDVELITSITGISKYIAKVIYVSFAYKDFISKNSMYAFIWYDPKLRDSWIMQGKAKITKRWNPYTRKKLFQAAFMSTLHSKYFKDIYDRAKNNWKHHFVSVISVVKKIVHIIFSLLKNKTTFNSNFTNIWILVS